MGNNKLPEMCFTVNTLDEDEVIMIRRGEKGYYSLNSSYRGNANFSGRDYADKLNAQLGVTRLQEHCMIIGSMFGWRVNGANPDTYTDEEIKRIENVDAK